MTDAADCYVTFTPFGRVDALFAADEPARLVGGDSAVSWVREVIERAEGANGIGLNVATVSPADYFNFCQPKGSGLTIIEPVDADTGAPDSSAEDTARDDDSVLLALDSAGPDLGPVFTEYKGDPAGAIERLLQERAGDARAVWTRHDIGAIDIIWGNPNAGLAKIARKHPEGIAKLPDMLKNGRLVRLPGGKTAVLVDERNPAHVTVLKLDWYGAAKTWVLTSYDDIDGAFTGGLALVDTKTLDSSGMGCSPDDQRTAGAYMSINQEVNNQPGASVLDDSENWHSKAMDGMKRRTEAELRYIIKDATEAAELGERMTPPNPKAGQYRDEAHYASMELQRRRKGGARVMDSANGANGDDFDPDEEFEAIPAADEVEGAY